jgi:hypothetical protein
MKQQMERECEQFYRLFGIGTTVLQQRVVFEGENKKA